MKRWTLASTCAAAALTLAACSSTSHTAPSARHPADTAARPAVWSDSAVHQLLQSYHWSLDTAQDASGARLAALHALEPKHQVKLDFVAGSAAGEQIVTTKVCNYMRGGYTLNGGKIQVDRLMSTQMACIEGGLAQLERAVGDQLSKMATLEVVQGAPTPKIVVGFSDGSRWHMSGTPTDATRYGSAGETIFLEVAAQTQPCTHGAAQMQCLQVRELKYDNAGRKTIAGDWQHFYGDIQGYQHDSNTRNVLRIKRYPIANPAADAGRFAYVLDMRVESEVVRR